MMKKIAALIGAGAMLLSVATPAFAWNWSYVDVENYSEAIANTGGNSQDNSAVAEVVDNDADAGSSSGARNMTTGSATAVAGAGVTVSTCLYDWSCGDCYLSLNQSDVSVYNAALAGANTGGNSQNNSAVATGYGNDADAGSSSGVRNMTTGPAVSNAQAFTVVNTTLVW